MITSDYAIQYRGDIFTPKAGKISMPSTLDAPLVCAVCGKVIDPPLPGEIAAGYALDSDGSKVCYSCCAERDRAQMRQTGEITLYLTVFSFNDGTPRHGYVGNWPGTLRFDLNGAQIKKSRHNWGLARYDVWFTFEGDTWHGVNIGDSQILRCKRNKPPRQTKPRPHYIAGAGIHGCLYACCDWFETKTAAAEYIGFIHDLSQRAVLRLRRDMYIDLDLHEHGNEYAEITECWCDSPEDHSDA